MCCATYGLDPRVGIIHPPQSGIDSEGMRGAENDSSLPRYVDALTGRVLGPYWP